MSDLIWIIAIENHGSVFHYCYTNIPDNLQFTWCEQHLPKMQSCFVCCGIFVYPPCAQAWYFTGIPLDGTEGDKICNKMSAEVEYNSKKWE